MFKQLKHLNTTCITILNKIANIVAKICNKYDEAARAKVYYCKIVGDSFGCQNYIYKAI